MPMKLNVGVSRKVGLPGYGSVGASCHLELELDSGLLEKDLDAFHAQVRGVYVAAHQAVHDELARLQAPVQSNADDSPSPRLNRAPVNGHTSETGNGYTRRAQDSKARDQRSATPSQVKAILAIARRHNVDLPGLLRQEFGAERAEDLTIRQASELIDLLKNQATT
jgi:hypothetical protein